MSATVRRGPTSPVPAARRGRRGERRGQDERPRCGLLLRGEREHPDARRVGRRVRGAGALLRRRRPAAAEQAAAGAPLPAARAAGARAARPAAVGRRPALPDPVPRPAHGGARSGRGRAAAQPGRPRAGPAAGHGQAPVGAVAGRGPGGRPLGDHLQGPPLHGRRRRRQRPHAADVRPRPERPARAALGRLGAPAQPLEPVAAHRSRRRRARPPGAAAELDPEPQHRRPRRQDDGRPEPDHRLDRPLAGQAGRHAHGAQPQRTDRAAPPLGVDRREVRGVQGRAEGVRRHGQRRRPHGHHPRGSATC